MRRWVAARDRHSWKATSSTLALSTCPILKTDYAGYKKIVQNSGGARRSRSHLQHRGQEG